MAFDGCMTVTYLITSILFVCLDGRSFKPPQIEDTKYWERLGQKELERALDEDFLYNKAVARNVILAIGDGMGLSTVTASRIYDGQSKGQSGEENSLLFERFPHSALLKTYSLDWQVPDSASTAFCMMSGIKAKALTYGLDNSVKFNVCAPQKGHEINTILDWSLAAGKSVGIVTTDSVVSATPAASYAHTPSRLWHNDHVTKAPCRDIARQLIEDNPLIHVILGGGKYHFIPRDLIPANSSSKLGRRDGRNLIEEWLQRKKSAGAKHRFVDNATNLKDVDAKKVDYLFGLFSPSRMPFIHEREKSIPTLEEMTRKAIEILSKNDKGFFLLIEGLTNDPFFPRLDKKPATTLGYNNGPGWSTHQRPDIHSKDLKNIKFQYSGGRPSLYATHSGEDVAVYARGPWAHLLHGVHEQSYIAHVLAYASCVGNGRQTCRKNAKDLPPQNVSRFGQSDPVSSNGKDQRLSPDNFFSHLWVPGLSLLCLYWG